MGFYADRVFPFLLTRAVRHFQDDREGVISEALPFRGDSFDTAVSFLVFCSVSDPAVAAAEVFRVLKPGGKVMPL